MARQKKQFRAFIGIMPRRIISDFDGFSIDIDISSPQGYDSDRVNLQLIARPSDYDGERVWYVHLGYRFITEYADLYDLKHAMKALTGIHRYIDKLPVKPELPHQYVLAILHKFNVQEVTVVYYPSEHSRAEIHENTTSLVRVSALIEKILEEKTPALMG